MILVIIDGCLHNDKLWVLVQPLLLVVNDSFGNR